MSEELIGDYIVHYKILVNREKRMQEEGLSYRANHYFQGVDGGAFLSREFFVINEKDFDQYVHR
jgi:hypothetical protein